MPKKEIKTCGRCGAELHPQERHLSLEACFGSLVERLRAAKAPIFPDESEEDEKPADAAAPTK
jgi:hypothetical protein